MSSAHVSTRSLAERVIAHEAKGRQASAKKPTGVFHITEEFRPHLVTLMGNTGFRALLSRALALASAEAPWLRAVQVNADGFLGGLAEVEAQVTPKELAEGRVLLLAHLFELMVAFIGEDLTLRLAREAWPKLPLDDLDVGERRRR